MTYILILLYTLGGLGGGIALTAIPGFATKEKCDAAGAAWHKTEHEADRSWECIAADVDAYRRPPLN